MALAEATTHKQSKISFYNLSNKTAQNKPILKQISGNFNSASLVAILGTSGAGKTTLLDILSGYHRLNATWDKLEVNGSTINFESSLNVSCYLTQDINLNDLLTVRENLHFAAELKLGLEWSQEDKTAKIEELLDSCALSAVECTRAGVISGGERKRLALALEMISEPAIMFLDEPTTGLDISTINQILALLKKIANKGKTVICTIHQLSASQLEMFDQIYVICDGQCAYQGRPNDMVRFLEEQGFTCGVYHNPADYIIELCSGDYGTDKATLLIDAAQNGRAFVEKNLEGGFANIEEATKTPTGLCVISWWKQFGVLLQRERKKMSRNLILLPIRIFSTNLMTFCAGCIFWDIGNDASKVWSNHHAALFLIFVIVFSGIMYPVLSWSLEVQLVKREYHNRYYTILQYYLVTFLLDLPICVLTTSTSSMLVWYMSGQPIEIDRIVLFQLFMITFGCIVNSVGYLAGTVGLPLIASLTMALTSQYVIMVFSGFGPLFKDLPWLAKILSRIFYFRQVAEGSLIAIFGLGQRKLICPEEKEYCFYKYSRQFLMDNEVDPNHYSFSVLFVWFLLIKVVTYYIMRYKLTS